MISQEFKDKNFYSWLYFFIGIGVTYQGIVYFKGFLSPLVTDISLIESSEGYLHISELLFFSLFIIPIGFAFGYLIVYMCETFLRGYILRISTTFFKSFFLGNIAQSLFSIFLGLLIPLLFLIFSGLPTPVVLSIFYENLIITSLIFQFIRYLFLGKFKKEFGTIPAIMKLYMRSFYIFLLPGLISLILCIVNEKVFSSYLFDYYIYSNKTYTLIASIVCLIPGILLILVGNKKISLLKELNPKNWKIKDDIVQDTEDNIIENIEDENNSSS